MSTRGKRARLLKLAMEYYTEPEKCKEWDDTTLELRVLSILQSYLTIVGKYNLLAGVVATALGLRSDVHAMSNMEITDLQYAIMWRNIKLHDLQKQGL